MRRLPPLGALEAFVAVARHSSVRAASEELSLSPSAVSRRIQALEHHLDRKLFDRAAGDFALNPDGEALLSAVGPAIERLAEAVEQSRGAETDTVHLGVVPAFASHWLLPRLTDFKTRHPGIRLDLDTTLAPRATLTGSLDAAIVLATQPDEAFYSRKLCQQRIFAVCSPGFLAEHGLREPADIKNQTVLVHRRVAELLDVWLERMGVRGRPRKVEYYDTGSVQLEAAVHGHGVAIVLHTMARHMLETGRLVRPFDETIDSPISYWFFAREGARASRPLSRFHDWLVAEVEREAP